MDKLTALLLFVILHGGVIEHGYAPRYAPGVMERVARNRDMRQEQCMISSPTEPLGSWLWVYGVNTGNLERCRVMDVSAPKDRARHIRTRRVVELGYQEAIRLCGRKHMHDPPTKCPIMTIKL